MVKFCIFAMMIFFNFKGAKCCNFVVNLLTETPGLRIVRDGGVASTSTTRQSTPPNSNINDGKSTT